jgi:hypothetical protein
VRFFIKHEGLDAFIEANGLGEYVLKPLRYIPDMCVMEFPEDFDVEALVALGCEIAPDTTFEAQATEPAVSYSKDYPVCPPLWHLDAICARGRSSRSSTTNRTRKGAGVDIYIVDSTTTLAHPEFSSVPGRYITVNDDITSTHPDWYPGPYGFDNTTGYESHGCATAMVAGGDTVGVAPEATIVVVPVATPTVAGILMTDIVDGWNAVIARVTRQNPYRHAVINYSIGRSQHTLSTWSSKYYALDPTAVAYKAVQDTYNIPIIKASGNAVGGYAGNAFSAFSPPGRMSITNFAEGNGDVNGLNTPIFSVGSCEIDDRMSSWCSYGDIMVTAPGVGVFLPRTLLTTEANATSWKKWKGTSFSAPAVAGVVALYLQGLPTTTPADLNVLGTWLVDNSTKGVLTGIGTYEDYSDPFLHFAGQTLAFSDAAYFLGVQRFEVRNGVIISNDLFATPAGDALWGVGAYTSTDAIPPISISRYTTNAYSALGDYDKYYGYGPNGVWYEVYLDLSPGAGSVIVPVDEAAEYAAHPTPNRMLFNPYSTYVDHYADPQTFIFDADTDKLRIRCSKISWSGFAMNQQTASVLSGTLPPGVSLSCDHKSCFLTCDSLASAETTTPQTIVVRVVENQNAENNTFDIPCTITVSHARGYGIEIFDEAGAPANIIDGYGLQLLNRTVLTGTGSHSFSFPLNGRNVTNGELRVITEPLDSSVITANRDRLIFQRNVVPSVWVENDTVEVRVFVHVTWGTKETCVIPGGNTLVSLEAASQLVAEVWSTEASEFPYGGLDKL